MSKRHILLSQVFMTFIMATAMSGIMGIIIAGPSIEWLRGWPLQILIAWPIAFALTMFAWPASMALAARVGRPRGDAAAS